MVTEGIHNAPDAPSVGIGDRHHFRGPGANGLRTHRRGIFDHQEHADGAAAERFGTEVQVRFGFFRDPKLRAVHRELPDAAARDAEQFARAERRFVELDGPVPIPDGQRGG